MESVGFSLLSRTLFSEGCCFVFVQFLGVFSLSSRGDEREKNLTVSRSFLRSSFPSRLTDICLRMEFSFSIADLLVGHQSAWRIVQKVNGIVRRRAEQFTLSFV